MTTITKLCTVENCKTIIYSKGLCNKHYIRNRKYGDPLYSKMPERHGMSNNPEFKTWVEMKRRVYTKHRKGYERYGGRGIIVCDRWLDSKEGFNNFLLDMGERPEGRYSIDRIDVNGNYEPANCRWATYKEQNNNRQVHTLITIGGITKNAKQWADEYNIPDTTFYNRIRRGWSGEDLISPIDTRHSSRRYKKTNLT